MAVAMIGIAVVTIAAYSYLNDALFFAAYPGLICGLLITGGHGGTSFQELLSRVIAVLVNMSIVALLFLTFLFWIPRRRAQRMAAEAEQRGDNV